MKSWPLILALLGAPAAAAEPLLELVEHAPMLRIDRAGPPEPGRSWRTRSGSLRWSTRATPGMRVELALAPVSAQARVVARLDDQHLCELGELAGVIPNAWRQSSAMVPDGRTEWVAEVLTLPADAAGREGSSSTEVAGAAPLPVRLVGFTVPSDAEPGRLSGSVSVDGRRVLELTIEVLAPLPAVPADPMLAFYRGRLVESAEAAWPEKVDAAMLLHDLRLMRQAGVTHATYYGSVESLPEARRLWREAGFETEPLLVGWYPGAMARVSDEQAREAVARVRRLRVSEDGAPRAFWTVDEPIREELQLARRKAAMIDEGGGLSTATLQVETAHALRHEIDLHLMDNYLTERPLFDEAVRSVREAGSTPWGYWQGFGESARWSRWNAGFRQLDEPTRGQCFYAYGHTVGDPLDDTDGGYKEMSMVHAAADGRVRLETLQWLGLKLGLEDLRVARGAQALVREARLDGFAHRSVSRLERELDRARQRWSSRRSPLGRYSWDDVARPGEGGPPAAALERTRQRILHAVADLQAARAERSE